MIYIALSILIVGLSFSIGYGKKNNNNIEMDYSAEALIFLIAASILLFKGCSI